MAKDSDIIKDALEQYQVALTAEGDNRALMLEDKKFAKLGGKEQWPEEVWNSRTAAKRPCLTINRMPSFLKQVVNDQRMNKPSILTRPVDDKADILTARILQGLVRNIEVSSNADRAYDMAFDDAVTMGEGYFRIVTEYVHDETFEQDIRIRPVENMFTVHLDPDDLFAPKWGFITDKVKNTLFKAKYGIEPSAIPSGGAGDALQRWYDKDSTQVAEYWRIETQPKKLLLVTDAQGNVVSTIYEEQWDAAYADQYKLKIARERKVDCPYVKQYMMTGQELVDEPTAWAGKYIPIIPVLGEQINIEGKRHLMGLVRHAKDPQRNFNYWRTVATETVALQPLAPWTGAVGQFETDADKWAKANREPHAYLQYDIVMDESSGTPLPLPPPQRMQMAGIPAGAIQEALNSSDDMKSVMGIHDASLGARSNETSGRAIMARQREGDVSTFNFMDGFARDSLTLAGRMIIDLAPKIYDTARVVRVLGVNDEPSMAQVNRMFMGPDGKARMHDLNVGKYDVVVKVGPSFTTQREEARTLMMEFIRAFPPATAVLGPMLVKYEDWPDAEKVAAQLQALLPPPAQGNDPERQQMQQMIQGLQQQLAQIQGDRGLEARKVSVDEYEAETDRLKVMGPAMSPQQIQALVVQTIHEIFSPPQGDAMPQGAPMGPPGGMPPPMQGQQQQAPMQAPPAGAF